jgi:hypothetical protein
MDLARGGLDADTNQRRAWAEIRELSQERGKLAATEQRRLTDMQKTIKKEQAVFLFGAIMHSVRMHILDEDLYQKGPRAILMAIQRDIDELIIAPAQEQQALPFNGASHEQANERTGEAPPEDNGQSG